MLWLVVERKTCIYLSQGGKGFWAHLFRHAQTALPIRGPLGNCNFCIYIFYFMFILFYSCYCFGFLIKSPQYYPLSPINTILFVIILHTSNIKSIFVCFLFYFIFRWSFVHHYYQLFWSVVSSIFLTFYCNSVRSSFLQQHTSETIIKDKLSVRFKFMSSLSCRSVVIIISNTCSCSMTIHMGWEKKKIKLSLSIIILMGIILHLFNPSCFLSHSLLVILMGIILIQTALIKTHWGCHFYNSEKQHI